MQYWGHYNKVDRKNKQENNLMFTVLDKSGGTVGCDPAGTQIANYRWLRVKIIKDENQVQVSHVRWSKTQQFKNPASGVRKLYGELYRLRITQMGSKTDLTVNTVGLPVSVNLMFPSTVQVSSVSLALEMATIILWVAGVRSSTRKRALSVEMVDLGMCFRFFSKDILNALVVT